MCGRYTLRKTAREVAEAFDAELLDDVDWAGPRYNIAPTQDALFVRRRTDADGEGKDGAAAGSDGEGAGDSVEGGRQLVHGRWGLVPSWVDDPDDFPTLINARSETASEKPAFRGAFAGRRCLVPADGFYEWQEQGSGPKQPFHLRLGDDRPFAFAGLWERWGEEESGDHFRSYTILTTEASDLVATVHDRQPAILEPGDYDAWMDPETGRDDLAEMVRPLEPAGLELQPIGRLVNDPSNDGPEVLAAT